MCIYVSICFLKYICMYFIFLYYFIISHEIVNRDFIPNFFVIYRPQPSKADSKRIESIIPI